MRARFLKWLSRWFVTRAAYDHAWGFAHDTLQSPVSSGVCCCGDNVDSHNYYSGHSPVDSWDYAVERGILHLNRLKENPYDVR